MDRIGRDKCHILPNDADESHHNTIRIPPPLISKKEKEGEKKKLHSLRVHGSRA